MRSWSIATGVAIWLLVLTANSTLAAEITVNTAADDNGGNPAECSLREAILAAILNVIVDGCSAGQVAPAVDTIRFAIGTGVQTITIEGSQLDEILDPVIIDGTTQPGFAGTPLIELRRGTGPGLEGTYALRVRAGGGGSTIKGLAISDWSQRTNADPDHSDPAYGIRIDGANNVTIQSNWFGLRANGTSGGGNAADLTIINGSQNTQVGGSTAAARNVFTGTSPGVNPDSISISGATTTGTRIQGNFFGVTPDGTARLDGASIVLSSGASSMLLGGPNPGERNIIAVSVVEFGGTGSGHQVIGNYFGVNVNGVDLPGTAAGLTIGGANLIVRGNVLNAATIGGSGTVVQGNLVGLAPDGVTALDGSGTLSISGTGNTVGGTTAAERNVIASNSGTGLTLSGTNHIVQGNYIGTDATGQVARPNANGVQVGGTGHRIGGAGAGERNVIAGNTGYGVQITGSGHVVAGNFIGVAADGTTALGNGGRGITFNSNDTNPVTIGGTTAGAGNLIANNGAQGIRNDFSTRQRVSILGNSIHSNASLGIMLGFGLNPRANDAGDADTGPSTGQNYPVLTSAASRSSTTIAGTLNSTPATTGYRIELFSNAACDASGSGEGQTFLGFTTLDTNADGNGSFSTTVPTTLSAGTPITATATDPQGNTSELSACFNVTGGGGGGTGPIVVTPTSGLVTTETGGTATFTVKLAAVPTSAVTVPLASSDPTEGAVSPATLTFQPNSTALNEQTVTVTGVDDSEADGAVAYTIVTGAASSSDPADSGVDPADVAVTNQDNEGSAPNCTPARPAVKVSVAKGGPGVLNVTIQAGQGTIAKLDVGTPRPADNARVSVVGGPQSQTGSFTFTPTASTSMVQLTVESPDRTKATTVPLVVTDGCGGWPTFVGGGAGSF